MSIGTRELSSESLTGFDVSLDRTTSVVAAMLGTDALLWWLVYDGQVPMPGMMWLTEHANVPMAAPGAMELGAFHVGTLDAFVGYAVMWGVMMWAMMHPAMTRFTREYAKSHQGGAVGAALALVAFISTYHLVWLVSAVVPLTFHAVLPGGIYGFTQTHTIPVIGSALVLTGVYQLTSFKHSLLRSCCADTPPHTQDVPDALTEGLSHGLRCVASSFALFFVLMPFFGEMNGFWMLAFTAVVAIERLPSWGHEIATAVGVTSLLAGVLVLLVQPDLGIAFTGSM